MGARAREARPPHYSLVEIDIYSCPASSVGCDNKYIRKEHLRDLKDRTHYPQQEDAELFFVSLSLVSYLSIWLVSFESLFSVSPCVPSIESKEKKKKVLACARPIFHLQDSFFF